MKHLSIKSIAAISLVSILITTVPGLDAAPMIDEILVPPTVVQYNTNGGGIFSVGGPAGAPIKVNYDDGSTQLINFAAFSLNTGTLTGIITENDTKIAYNSDGTTFGIVSVTDQLNTPDSPYLSGSLNYLELEIVNQELGHFEGTGRFDVTGGSLANDFGNNGGLATVGISFDLPSDFSSGFFAVGNTKLFPEAVGAPEPSSIAVGSIGLLSLGIMIWRRKRES